MDCIICQDSGTEPLQDNTNCPCKYKRHPSCWIDYVHSKNNVICPLCRKDLTVKPTPKPTQSRPQAAPPYSPQLYTVPEETGQQISYHEFVDIVGRSNSYQQDTTIEVRSATSARQQVTPQPISTSQKLFKIVVCLGILITIVVMIIVIF